MVSWLAFSIFSLILALVVVHYDGKSKKAYSNGVRSGIKHLLEKCNREFHDEWAVLVALENDEAYNVQLEIKIRRVLPFIKRLIAAAEETELSLASSKDIAESSQLSSFVERAKLIVKR